MSGTAEVSIAVEHSVESGEAPPPDSGGVVHLLDPGTENVALCGIRIIEWVSAAEYSKRPCRCCIRERMARS